MRRILNHFQNFTGSQCEEASLVRTCQNSEFWISWMIFTDAADYSEKDLFNGRVNRTVDTTGWIKSFTEALRRPSASLFTRGKNFLAVWIWFWPPHCLSDLWELLPPAANTNTQLVFRAHVKLHDSPRVVLQREHVQSHYFCTGNRVRSFLSDRGWRTGLCFLFTFKKTLTGSSCHVSRKYSNVGEFIWKGGWFC